MEDVVLLPRTHNQWKKMYSVESMSRKGTYYVVAQDVNDHWGCSCPVWIYNPARPECKHIKRVKSTLGRNARVQVFTENDIDARPSLKKALSRFALVEV